MWKKEFLAEMYDGARQGTSVAGSRAPCQSRERCEGEEQVLV